jgi:hypothetical protein
MDARAPHSILAAWYGRQMMGFADVLKSIAWQRSL